jgi:hypothetical protein
MAFERPSGATTIPSVADAKRQLAAWGDAADTHVAVSRSKIVRRAAGLAMVGVIAGLAVLAGHRLLRRRDAALRGRLDRAPAKGLPPVSRANAPANHQRSIRSWLGWMIVTRVGRWLLPHAVQAARRSMARGSMPSGRQPQMSVQ